MIGFARRLARNAVGIGMAIGILMAPQVANAARTHLEFATSAAATHGTTARATPALAALPDYVTLQKSNPGSDFCRRTGCVRLLLPRFPTCR